MERPNTPSSPLSMNASSPSGALGGATIGGTTLQGTTPVPNVLFDTYLPRLSDTELRVLLVVNRATLGWKEGTGRKASDWLSHRQLQTRTGRAGASVSHAIQSLVSRGLLIVQDAGGRARDSAHSRRATRGRLYYRLSDTLLAPAQAHALPSGPGEEPYSSAPPMTTPITPKEVAGDVAKISTSPGRLQKLKTTKETGTKEKEAKMSSSESEVEAARVTFDDEKAKSGAAEDPLMEDTRVDDLEAQVERFVGVFAAAYHLARPGEAVPPIEPAERTLLRECLRHPGPTVLQAWLPAFFGSSFGFARRRAWSLGCYLNCLFILQAQAGSNPLHTDNPKRAARDISAES